MSSIVTQTSIANRALQLLGYKPIGSIHDNDRGARAVSRAYYPVLHSELRANFWGFAIKRAELPASTTKPAFGRNNYFPLPPDFLDLAMPDQTTTYNFGQNASMPMSFNDFQIENMGDNTLAITSNMDGPLQIRYVTSAVTESIFDACFSEAFAASLAMEICEELTQSNTKIQMAEQLYKDAMDKAKQRNAFEMKPIQPPVDRYITIRM